MPKVEGEAAKIAFNGKVPHGCTGSPFNEGEIALETTTPSSPGVIRPIGAGELRSHHNAHVCPVVSKFGDAPFD